eukprot:TRINITY_DN65119_c0_g1_i1.p1 TRINITY_DN65119_c0_g1~~TRINITY_DN65119_c0_g1_i1.p1  ORF type:complete len:1365 (+),score=325.16 TRINITY_DN65119_c0_g1_i1:159-4253(+)
MGWALPCTASPTMPTVGGAEPPQQAADGGQARAESRGPEDQDSAGLPETDASCSSWEPLEAVGLSEQPCDSEVLEKTPTADRRAWQGRLALDCSTKRCAPSLPIPEPPSEPSSPSRVRFPSERVASELQDALPRPKSAAGRAPAPWWHSQALPWALAAGLLLYLAWDMGILTRLPGMWSLQSHSIGDASSAQSLRPAPSTAAGMQQADRHTAVGGTALAAARQRQLAGGGEDHQPPHEAMLFLFEAIVLGVMITHLTTIPTFHGLSQTVALFVLGIVYSLVTEGMGLSKEMGIFGRSYVMCMDIDPHLLLFTMLPALLTGDAMGIDTAVARRVSKQCIYLASVGVVVPAMVTAAFLYFYLPYNWSFNLSLVTGSILCATDPVAVVALLKELGASPTLTVQIQGESLLNDGTAIVLYTIATELVKGKTYDFYAVITFLVKSVGCAVALGLAIGYFFLYWIRLASSKLNHHNPMIQCSLTLCSAYWSFIIAEVFHISGVLATVAAALVLADKMWPCIVDKESMHTVWHMFEYLGNTLIFFLAGALTGKTMVHIGVMDYVHLLVIYLMLTFLRLFMLLGSRRILDYLAPEGAEEITTAEILVMTWGGLRGAVGLALALQVASSYIDGHVDPTEAYRVLFYTSGVAFLTLAVNASTCPMLVKMLGLTKLPNTKQRMLMLVHRQLIDLSDKHQEDSTDHEVGEALRAMLSDVEEHILSQCVEDRSDGDSDCDSEGSRAGPITTMVTVIDADGNKSAADIVGGGGLNLPSEPENGGARYSMFGAPARKQSAGPNTVLKAQGPPERKSRMPSMLRLTTVSAASGMSRLSTASSQVANTITELAGQLHRHGHQTCTTMELIRNLADWKLRSGQTDKAFLRQLDFPELPFETNEHEIVRMVRRQIAEEDFQRALADSFLNLLNSYYMRSIESGDIMPGSPEAVILLKSITDAKHWQSADLLDSTTIFDFLNASIYEDGERMGPQVALRLADKSRTAEMVASRLFNSVMLCLIFLNGVLMLLEETLQSKEDGDASAIGRSATATAWFCAELFFNLAFTAECLLKMDSVNWRMKDHFKEGWHRFDFVLVVLGLGGVVLDLVSAHMASSPEAFEAASGSGVLRMARLFKVMRLMRLFRIFRVAEAIVKKLLVNKEALKIVEHLQKIKVILTFAHAHAASQLAFVQIFGKDGKPDIVEVGRIVLQSKIQLHKAIHTVVSQEQSLDHQLLKFVTSVRESKTVAEDLEAFVMKAMKGGVINGREAHAFLGPLHQHLKECMKGLQNAGSSTGRQRMKSFVWQANLVASDLSDSDDDIRPLPMQASASDVADSKRMDVDVFGRGLSMSSSANGGSMGRVPTIQVVKPAPHKDEVEAIGSIR